MAKLTARSTRRTQAMGDPRKANDVVGNRLWMLLPSTVRERLSRHAQRVQLQVGQTVSRAYDQLRAVYFPETAIISCLAQVHDGQTLEVALIGSDGMAGIAVLPGTCMTYDCVVQVAGTALKVDAHAMAHELHHPGAALELLGRYAWVLLDHSIQTAACNNFHSVRKRCARLLLMMRDLVERDSFPITQDLLALMLGVRRASITKAARAFQRAGAIEYKHGRLTVLNRRGLEAEACECYRVMHETHQRLLGY